MLQNNLIEKDHCYATLEFMILNSLFGLTMKVDIDTHFKIKKAI